ncbi:MAG: hypothetical protein ACPLYD_14075, partial [Anaerolineae bacterium]
ANRKATTSIPARTRISHRSFIVHLLSSVAESDNGMRMSRRPTEGRPVGSIRRLGLHHFTLSSSNNSSHTS